MRPYETELMIHALASPVVITEKVNEGLVAAALEAFEMLVDPTSGAADVELWTMLNNQLNEAEKRELNARLAGWVK